MSGGCEVERLGGHWSGCRNVGRVGSLEGRKVGISRGWDVGTSGGHVRVM